MKPDSIRRKELIDNIVKSINESMLPPFVVEPIVRDVLTQVVQASEQQYKADVEAWEKQSKEEAITDG